MDDSIPVAVEDSGCFPDNAVVTAKGLDDMIAKLDAGCPLPTNLVIRLTWTPSLEETLKPHMPPEVTPKVQPVAVPAVVDAHVPHGDSMVPEEETQPEAHHPEPPLAVAPPAPAPAPTTTASVQAPGSAATELIGLVQAAGGNAGLAVVLAAVAVLGGGTAFKFYSQNSKQKHEERMKKLENDQDAHQQCSAARLQLEAKVAQLESKVETVSQKSASISISDDLEERVEKLEKQVNQKTTRKKTT